MNNGLQIYLLFTASSLCASFRIERSATWLMETSRFTLALFFASSITTRSFFGYGSVFVVGFRDRLVCGRCNLSIDFLPLHQKLNGSFPLCSYVAIGLNPASITRLTSSGLSLIFLIVVLRPPSG